MPGAGVSPLGRLDGKKGVTLLFPLANILLPVLPIQVFSTGCTGRGGYYSCDSTRTIAAIFDSPRTLTLPLLLRVSRP